MQWEPGETSTLIFMEPEVWRPGTGLAYSRHRAGKGAGQCSAAWETSVGVPGLGWKLSFCPRVLMSKVGVGVPPSGAVIRVKGSSAQEVTLCIDQSTPCAQTLLLSFPAGESGELILSNPSSSPSLLSPDKIYAYFLLVF